MENNITEETQAETVAISKKEYDQLLRDQEKLTALEGAGVDNWEGYDIAMEAMKENA